MPLDPAIKQAVQPLFDKLPLTEAMTALTPTQPRSAELSSLAASVVASPAIAAHPALASAIWLYVDELDKSHTISQSIETPTGSYWHGVMHRREGDFSNSHYWFRNAGDHPAIPVIAEASPGYDPHQFIDDVERAATGKADGDSDTASLIARQQQEWLAMFTWCAANP